MENFIIQNLTQLNAELGNKLFIVGGFTRNLILNGTISKDVDLASEVMLEDFSCAVKKVGGEITSASKKTGTVKFLLNNYNYEHTTFRKDEYKKGKHFPSRTVFVGDLKEDALRRDFKCNAIYLKVSTGEIVDPLNGTSDVKNRVLSTVKTPDEVFCHDGVRLLRLARFSAELGFTPTLETIKFAKKYSYLILDLSLKAIKKELEKILLANEKYPFSPKNVWLNGIKILSRIGLIDKINQRFLLEQNEKEKQEFEMILLKVLSLAKRLH